MAMKNSKAAQCDPTNHDFIYIQAVVLPNSERIAAKTFCRKCGKIITI
jgi:hypothetical protein